MKQILLCLFLLSPVTAYPAEPQSPQAKPEQPEARTEEPQLYDYYVALKRMQESMAGRSLDEQARMEPQLRQVERLACDRAGRDRRERLSRDQYRQQGGDQFLVFALQLEQYCRTLP